MSVEEMERRGKEAYKHDGIRGSHPNSILSKLKEEDPDRYRECLLWLRDIKQDQWTFEQWATDGFVSRDRTRDNDYDG